VSVNTLDNACNSPWGARKIAKYSTFIGHIGVMNNMLFQHNNTRSTLCPCGIIIRVLLTEEVVTSKVGRMAPEERTIACLAWAYSERLEELAVHSCRLR
jgi:hypothetical protein